MVMGVYSDDQLKGLIREKIIFAEEEIGEKQLQPSSLDLRLGSQAFRMPFSSVPVNGDFEDFLKNNSSYGIDLEGQNFLHKNEVYVIRLQEGLFLPPHMAARANPKSSIGRTDIHVRLITDNGNSFDEIPVGYRGNLWLEVCSRSFDIKTRPGDCLNQLRLFDKGLECLERKELESLHRDSGLLARLNLKKGVGFSGEEFEKFVGVDRVYTSLDLDPKNPGYVAKRNAPLVDLSLKDCPASNYFDKISLDRNGQMIADKDAFYILSSKEIVHIPQSTCAEMSDVETASGEFRSHFAGFFDPNFNAQATFELRNYGVPFLLVGGQKIASMKYFPMKTLPLRPYGGGDVGSHYQGQKGPRLAKFFDMEK
jgi:dCTP deaminase